MLILKLKDKQKQLLNVSKARLRFISITQRKVPQVYHGVFKLNFMPIRNKPCGRHGILLVVSTFMSDSLFLIPCLISF